MQRPGLDHALALPQRRGGGFELGNGFLVDRAGIVRQFDHVILLQLLQLSTVTQLQP
ncbi:hypothetical protein D3C81_1951540 [compost metagenome]